MTRRERVRVAGIYCRPGGGRDRLGNRIGYRVRDRLRDRRGVPLGRSRSPAGSLGMTSAPWPVLVVRMVGQVLDAQPLSFLHKRPFGSQRQLTPVVTYNRTRLGLYIGRTDVTESGPH